MKLEQDHLDTLDFTDRLLPLIAQHARSGEVLMQGWADREAAERTLETGTVWFWSRSKGRLWQKGETSGNVLRLVSLHADCDGDALLALVEPAGPTCHTGRRSCFDAPPLLVELADVLDRRAAEPTEGSYTSRLLSDRNLRLKKLGEEMAELVAACADGGVERVGEEAADVVYHTLVACRAAGVGLDSVLRALEERRG